MCGTRYVASALGCLAALTLGGCVTYGESSVPLANSAVAWNALDSGRPHYMPTIRMSSAKVMPDTFLTYGGGPVLVNPKMYLIFWGYKSHGDPDHVAKLLEQYGKHVGGSAYNNTYTQYYEVAGGKTIQIANPAKQFGGSWNDDSAIPKSPTDAQVAAEALRGVNHFGYDPNGSYVVATAHGRSGSGFGTVWCSYHSSTSYKGKNVSYTDLPYIPDGGTVCGANYIAPSRDQDADTEGVTIIEGHEFAETITDADPFFGWNSVEGEIADICAWHDVKNDPFGSKSYASQPEFSDVTESCVHSYP